MGTPTRRIALSRWQLASLAVLGGSGVAGAVTAAWKLATAAPVRAPARPTADESRLLAKVEAEKAQRQSEARKLRQAEMASGYQVDGEGNLTAPAVVELPGNKSLEELAGGPTGGNEEVTAAIADGIRGRRPSRGADDEIARGLTALAPPEPRAEKDEHARSGAGDGPMLGYSTVRGAGWASRRPEMGEGAGGKGAVPQAVQPSVERAMSSAEQRMTALEQLLPPGGGAGRGAPGERAGPGPSRSGTDLLPAQEQAQPLGPGSIGDMRIGGDGPEQVVRQGKFLDCVLVSEVRADLVESPVIGMVSRDFVSLGGQYVLVPAGAKLIGLAGRVQNLQQARVYIRFDRIIFPDQRSAYFPVRKVAAGDGVGSVGIEGDVDRHFGLMFGSAVMLGVVDGMAAAVEGANSSATPAARELIEARTSMNMSQVVAGILSRYGNVVPTVTVEAGTKMKVFFAADVRMTPYQRAHGSH